METQMGNEMSTNNRQRKYKEGPVATAIEKQTAKIPSDVYLWAAGAAITVSLVTQLVQSRRGGMSGAPTRMGQISLFVGQWAPTFLLLGVYNKIVKVIGRSDSTGMDATR